MGAKTASIVLAMAMCACGGAAQSDLFAPAGDTSSGGTPEDDASSSVDAGHPADARSDAPRTNDATVPDTGVDARPPPPDATPPDPGIACGGEQCTPGAQVCCMQRSTTGLPDTYSCTDAANCNGVDQVPIACDDKSDCAPSGKSQVCCATYSFDALTQTDQVNDVSCRYYAQCTQQNSMVVVCSTNDPTCPGGTKCQPSMQTFPGYNLCL